MVHTNFRHFKRLPGERNLSLPTTIFRFLPLPSHLTILLSITLSDVYDCAAMGNATIDSNFICGIFRKLWKELFRNLIIFIDFDAGDHRNFKKII